MSHHHPKQDPTKSNRTQSSVQSSLTQNQVDDRTLDEDLFEEASMYDVNEQESVTNPTAKVLVRSAHTSKQSKTQQARDYTVIEVIEEEQMSTPLSSRSNSSRSQQEVQNFTLPLEGVFKELSPIVKRRLLQVGRRIRYQAGEGLNNVGDPCQGLSFILGGKVRVEWMDALSWVPIALLNSGDVFGAMEWAESKLWEERLSAESEALILFIPTHVLNPLSATYPDLQRQVERYTERHTLHAHLGSNELFQSIPNEDLMHLIDIATMRYLDSGALVYTPTRIISLMFVIGRGEIEILCEDRVIQVLGRGELLNLELALGDRMNMTSARVLTPTTLYLMPFDLIEDLLAKAGQLQSLQQSALLLRERALND